MSEKTHVYWQQSHTAKQKTVKNFVEPALLFVEDNADNSHKAGASDVQHSWARRKKAK